MTFLTFVLIIVFLISFSVARFYKKQAQQTGDIFRHLTKLPEFDSGMLDCYVRFQGKVVSGNTVKVNSTLPINSCVQSACAFYVQQVIAHWKHKVKKPGKGMEAQKKLLFEQVSVPSIELENAKGRLQVTWDDFIQFDALHRLHTTRELVAECPEICRDKAEARFASYEVKTSWCRCGEEVIAYGKLVQNAAGELCLVHSKLSTYPSFIKLATPENQREIRTLIKENQDKYAAAVVYRRIAQVVLWLSVIGIAIKLVPFMLSL